MPAKGTIPFLVGMMLFTGVCNTLLTKYQDNQCVRNCTDPDPSNHILFSQPVLQTAQMFIGEMGSWLVIGLVALWRRRHTLPFTKPTRGETSPLLAAPASDSYDGATLGDDADADAATLDDDEMDPLSASLISHGGDRKPMTGWRVGLLALPACADIAGTTLMNVGLLFVAASIYQMTRGALVLFVGLFSVVFLKRRLGAYKWFALFVVVAGVALVGLAGSLSQDGVKGEAVGVKKPVFALRALLGVGLIAAAQVFTASQFVLEERIMEVYNVEPLRAVGWEGLWGFVVTVLGMGVGHAVYGRTEAGQYSYFDMREGLREITHYPAIGWSSLAIMVSIGGFNFFGLSVTRSVSATSRSTIDTCRTLFIWIVSLGLGWEHFKWLQVAGFALLVYGTFLFNDIVRPPLKACLGEREGELLPEGPV
ncbi:hypothetical protein EJ06DRAFT_493782, partial [Trichodelitschia bisporula]